MTARHPVRDNSRVRKFQKTKELTERINHRLKAVGLSARKASLQAGLDAEAIRNIRRGSEPRAGVLNALAPVLKCSLAYLNLNSDDVGEAEKPTLSVNTTGLHPALSKFLSDVQERLAARNDPELLRFYLSLAYLHDEWLATGPQPFSAPAFLARAHKLIEHYDLSSSDVTPQRTSR